MLTKRARALTPYALFAAKMRDWTPPTGLALESYDARSGILGIIFEVVLACQCEAQERLLISYIVSHDVWNDSKVCRDVIVVGILARMYEEAEQKLAEHTGVQR